MLISDNGQQCTSKSFERVAKAWDFKHCTISPRYSKSNEKVASAVKTAKQLLRKSIESKSDQYVALLDHRNTPTQGLTTSPARRLMSRRTRILIPTTGELLETRVIQETERQRLRVKKQAKCHNENGKPLPPLDVGDTVRMKPFEFGDKKWKKAFVTKRLDDRSYVV